MVLRCRGFFFDVQDQASSSVINTNPAGRDVQISEGQKGAIFNKIANETVTFILIIDSYSYVKGVELFIKQIDGVESVKADGNSTKLEVMGNVDPFKIRKMVECETKKKVELHFPSGEMQAGNREEKKGIETKLMKLITPIDENDTAMEKKKESIIVLKTKLSCEYCNQKLKKILKTKGLEMLKMDVEKDLVTIRGTMDVTELRSYIKDKLRKEVEVVDCAAVIFPTRKKDRGQAADTKKLNDGGAMTKSMVAVLKMRFDRDCSIQKIQKIMLKIKGVESVSITVEENLIVREVLKESARIDILFERVNREKHEGHYHSKRKPLGYI